MKPDVDPAVLLALTALVGAAVVLAPAVAAVAITLRIAKSTRNRPV